MNIGYIYNDLQSKLPKNARTAVDYHIYYLNNIYLVEII